MISRLNTVERSLFSEANKKRRPINCSFELLPLCNMNCDMCYVRLSYSEMEKKGRLRTVDEWLELARQIQCEGVLFLLLTGGEPLMYPEFKRLYLALRQMGFVITINTNGTLIDEDWAAFFGEYPPRRINVTLYGGSEETYQNLCHYREGFEKTKRGVRLLCRQNVDVKINVSLVKVNQADGLRMFQIAKELGTYLHVDTYMFPSTREREQNYNDGVRLIAEEAGMLQARMLKFESSPQEYMEGIVERLYKVINVGEGEEQPRPMGCHAGRCSFAINWLGEMRACTMLPKPSVPVFEVGFKTAWNIIVNEIEKVKLSTKCNVCRLRDVCSVCAASALLETGEYDGVPEYMCRYTQSMMHTFALEMRAMQGNK